MTLRPQPPTPVTEVHDSAAEALAAVDQQYTANRRTLVALLASANAPLSLPEIMELQPDLAQSSVYRTLGVLEQAGVALRIVTGDEFARFELAEAHSGLHHHHLICRNCGVTVEIEADPVAQWAKAVAAAHGYTAPEHVVDVFGLCPVCSGESAS